MTILLENFKSFIINELAEDIANQYEDWLKENSDKLPFQSIFKDKFRVVVNLDRHSIVDNILTKLKQKGKINYPEGCIEYQIKTEREGKTYFENKKLKIGKYILAKNSVFSEAEKQWWNKSGNPVKELLNYEKSHGNYSIVISRHPIDVVRMSDHKNITSCHNPKREYFKCAMADAKGAGAIAYLVKTDDLREHMNQLQDQDLFEDDDRNVGYIVPLARIRLRKIVHKEKEYDLAIPEKSRYGKDIVGFKETLKKWLYENQQDKLKGERPRASEFYLVGGSYQDNSGGALLNNFFDDELDRGEIEYKGEDEDYTGWQQQIEEEIENIHDREIESFKNVKPTYMLQFDDDGGQHYFLEGYATAEFEYPISLVNKEKIPSLDYQKRSKLTSELNKKLKVSYGIEELEIGVDSDALGITLTFSTNEPIVVDDYSHFLKCIKSELDEKYDFAKSEIYSVLVDNKILKATKAYDAFNYEDEMNFNHFEIDYNNSNKVKIHLSNPIPVTMHRVRHDLIDAGYFYYSYSHWVKVFADELYRRLEQWNKSLLFVANRQKRLFDVGEKNPFNVTIKPEVNFIGMKASHRPINGTNQAFLNLILNFTILDEDEHFDDLMKYIKFFDDNYEKLKNIIEEINYEVFNKFKQKSILPTLKNK